jgi:hypothetical protein
MSKESVNPDFKMWDFSTILEVTIDRPAKFVWPYFHGKNKDTWTKTDYRTVSGQSGQVGEIYDMVYPMPNQGGRLGFETLQVKTDKHLIIKFLYQRHEGGPRVVSGYDFITLNEVAGRTTVVLLQASYLPVDPATDCDYEAQKHNTFLADILQHLKKLVEGGPVSASSSNESEPHA